MRVVSHRFSGGDDDRKWQQVWRRRVKPDNEIPVTVGTAILLGHTDELAVAISELRVYRNGVEFTVSARARGRLARRRVLHLGMHGHRHRRTARSWNRSCSASSTATAARSAA